MAKAKTEKSTTKTPTITSSFFTSNEEPREETEIIDGDDTEEEVEEEQETDEEEETEEDNQEESEETEEEDSEKGEEESDDDTDFFTTIINDQAEKGVLFFDEEKEYEGTGEEIFDEVISDTLNKRWEEEYVQAIPEEYQSLFTALKAGRSITEWYENTQPIDYSTVDIEDEPTQKELIKQHLTATGFEEEDIEDSLQEFEDAGTLEKNAKKALKYLEKAEKGKAEAYEKRLAELEEQEEARREEEFKKFKAEVLSTEELGKRKLDKKTREKLLDHITKPVNKKGESQLVINQKSREKQLLFALLDMEGFDFSKLEQKAESKAASGLRAKLSKTTDPNAKGSGGSRRNEPTNVNKVVHGPWSSSR